MTNFRGKGGKSGFKAGRRVRINSGRARRIFLPTLKIAPTENGVTAICFSPDDAAFCYEASAHNAGAALRLLTQNLNSVVRAHNDFDDFRRAALLVLGREKRRRMQAGGLPATTQKAFVKAAQEWLNEWIANCKKERNTARAAFPRQIASRKNTLLSNLAFPKEAERAWENRLCFMAQKYPACWRDDLIQEGRIALWEARQQYQAIHKSRATFLTFATKTIRWRMAEFCRVFSPLVFVPRTAKAIGVSEMEIMPADALPHIEHETFFAFEQGRKGAPSIEMQVCQADRLQNALAVLSPRSRAALTLWAVEEWQYSDIALLLGVSQTRARQLCNEAIAKIQKSRRDVSGEYLF